MSAMNELCYSNSCSASSAYFTGKGSKKEEEEREKCNVSHLSPLGSLFGRIKPNAASQCGSHLLFPLGVALTNGKLNV